MTLTDELTAALNEAATTITSGPSSHGRPDRMWASRESVEQMNPDLRPLLDQMYRDGKPFTIQTVNGPTRFSLGPREEPDGNYTLPFAAPYKRWQRKYRASNRKRRGHTKDRAGEPW